ncbi:MAG: hypothetical protein ACK53L_07240, partial [Pirellulaceae bacterium]
PRPVRHNSSRRDVMMFQAEPRRKGRKECSRLKWRRVPPAVRMACSLHGSHHPLLVCSLQGERVRTLDKVSPWPTSRACQEKSGS